MGPVKWREYHLYSQLEHWSTRSRKKLVSNSHRHLVPGFQGSNPLVQSICIWWNQETAKHPSLQPTRALVKRVPGKILVSNSHRHLVPGSKGQTHLSNPYAYGGTKKQQNIHLYSPLEHWSTRSRKIFVSNSHKHLLPDFSGRTRLFNPYAHGWNQERSKHPPLQPTRALVMAIPENIRKQ